MKDIIFDIIFIIMDAVINISLVCGTYKAVMVDKEIPFSVFITIVVGLTAIYAILHIIVKYKWNRYIKAIAEVNEAEENE